MTPERSCYNVIMTAECSVNISIFPTENQCDYEAITTENLHNNIVMTTEYYLILN